MERLRSAAATRPPEQLQRLALGRSGEGEEAQVRLLAARSHHLVEAVFPVGLPLGVLHGTGAEDGFQFPRGLPGLAGMSLVHDHGVPALRDLRFPSLRLRLLLRGRFLLRLGTRRMQQPAQDERELLQRRDHDLGAVDQRRRKLLAVLVDGLHHTLGVLDLVDRVLELLV